MQTNGAERRAKSGEVKRPRRRRQARGRWRGWGRVIRTRQMVVWRDRGPAAELLLRSVSAPSHRRIDRRPPLGRRRRRRITETSSLRCMSRKRVCCTSRMHAAHSAFRFVCSPFPSARGSERAPPSHPRGSRPHHHSALLRSVVRLDFAVDA